MAPRQERAWHHFKGERHFFKAEGLFDLDLHWRLFDERIVPLDFEALWRRSERIDLRGVQVSVPSAEDHLLISCVHGSKHGWDTLKWIVDVAELLRSHPDLEWPHIVDRADAIHARRMLLLGLALADRLLDAALQPAMRKAIQDEPAVETLYSISCARLLRRLEVPEEDMAAALARVGAPAPSRTYRSIQRERSLDHRYRLAPVWTNQRILRHQERPLRQQARLALANALTPGAREIEVIALPRSLFFLYQGLRLGRLAAQGGMRAARLIGEGATSLPRLMTRGRARRRPPEPTTSPIP
jgi:hypothetical protein